MEIIYKRKRKIIYNEGSKVTSEKVSEVTITLKVFKKTKLSIRLYHIQLIYNKEKRIFDS